MRKRGGADGCAGALTQSTVYINALMHRAYVPFIYYRYKSAPLAAPISHVATTINDGNMLENIAIMCAIKRSTVGLAGRVDLLAQ